jgi:cobaltochelatase CobT|tara:strand:+ start:4730 stop:6559 length:1830 start_codon:yes stop_codon:yes gene_type:complete
VKEDTLDTFKRALSSTVKAIAEDKEIEVVFGGNSPSSEDKIILPEINNIFDLDNLSSIRGTADNEALIHKYRNNNTYSEFLPNKEKNKKIYESLENSRIQILGSKYMRGVKSNLLSLYEKDCQEKNYSNVTSQSDLDIENALEIYLKKKNDASLVPKSASHALSYWSKWLDSKIGDSIDGLLKNINDQEQFAQLANKLILDLKLYDTNENKDESEDDNKGQQTEELDNPDVDETESQSSMSDDDMENTEEEVQSEESEMPVDENNEEMQDLEDDGSENVKPQYKENKSIETILSEYMVYSNQFDEVITAQDLCEDEELNRLRKYLDQQLKSFQTIISRLANRLQRKLLAKQNRSWEFNIEEGLLDTSRLTRVITDPFYSLSFKKEKDTDFKDTVVSLLIDNSGSMRGRPITVAAMSADILARTLEKCGVKVEILGFTTKAWKGGKSRESWMQNNKPPSPGRLNDLRHIIYKAADEPWRRSKKNLGLMMREGLLKENIDGEALLWAHKRLQNRYEARKILMVISDGAPVDDSTLSVNSGNYLEKHLRGAINWIENKSDVQLLAVGIGHDVTRYYKKAVTIVDAEQLADVMTEQLVDLFEEYPIKKKNILS